MNFIPPLFFILFFAFHFCCIINFQIFKLKYYNFHTHTNFCDGTDEPEKYVISAISKNIAALGFSGHAPLPFDNTWSTRQDRMEEYFAALDYLKNKYKQQITIFRALEIDYTPGITKSFNEYRKLYKLDYTIGSVHLVNNSSNPGNLWFIDGADKKYIQGLSEIFNDNIEQAVTCYYRQIQEMLITQKPDIIGHLDKVKMNNKNRFFSEDEKWYKDLVNQTLKCISLHSKPQNPIVEVNTRGIYKKRTDSLFPSQHILEQCYILKIPITLNSDAHSPDELTNYFPEAVQILKDIGFKGIHILNNGKWKLKPFSEL